VNPAILADSTDRLTTGSRKSFCEMRSDTDVTPTGKVQSKRLSHSIEWGNATPYRLGNSSTPPETGHSARPPRANRPKYVVVGYLKPTGVRVVVTQNSSVSRVCATDALRPPAPAIASFRLL
jgi:hypothetical protein